MLYCHQKAGFLSAAFDSGLASCSEWPWQWRMAEGVLHPTAHESAALKTLLAFSFALLDASLYVVKRV